MKILIVDDEVDICDFVKNFLSERGFEVLVAHNGKEALAAVDEQQPPVMLLDIKMPVMNGIETLEELKKRKNTPKIILVTAESELEKAEELKYAGVINYITKPLSLIQLEKTILAVADKIKDDDDTGGGE